MNPQGSSIRVFFKVQILALLIMVDAQFLHAHEGHGAATYEVTPTDLNAKKGKYLRLKLLDLESGRAIAARLTLTINGVDYIPPGLGRHGLRFTSIHQRRLQRLTATYARGTGEVLIPLPDDAKSGTVTAAKGFEFIPGTAAFDIDEASTAAELRLKRWIDLQAEGWHAADEHLHYERTDPKHDGDWLNMLDGDGLSHAHFMVLKGGNLPGIWAQQFAYGKAGEARDDKRLIRPGEEYRDGAQGHINLLGIEEIISPISTGNMSKVSAPFNYPPLLDVFRRTHELGGIAGPAHGGSFGESSTAILDTVLGEVDFFEIANTHLYRTDIWYRLLNCGFIVPPVAGTDLPNFGFRDSWQPLLGEVRTYVRSGTGNNFNDWKQAIRRGEVFVTSGPLLRFDVNGEGPGGVVHLPPQGGELQITATLSSPRPLKGFELVSMGQPISALAKHSQNDRIYRLTIKKKLSITKSCWLATRGTGSPKVAVEEGLGIKQNVIAHSGVIQVLVGDQPIRSESDIGELRKQLALQKEYYRTNATYKEEAHRLRFVDLFEQAIKKLK